MISTVYDKGIHYGTNEKLTLDTKGDFYSNHVFEITGEYFGSCGSVGPTHEIGD
jgi:hypothetical protein